MTDDETIFRLKGIDKDFVLEDQDQVTQYLFDQITQKQQELHDLQAEIQRVNNELNFMSRELHSRVVDEPDEDK